VPAPTATVRRNPEPALRLLAIAAGGALGTLARYGVARAVVVPASGFPWATFAVNMVGSFVLGVVVTLVTERWPPTRFVRPFAAIGFCGGFTTFSTLMVEVTRRAQDGRVGPAALYLGASLGVGTAAAAAGVLAARGRRGAPADPGGIPDPDSLTTLAAERHPAVPPDPSSPPSERTAP
jgi:CrcB protein